MATYSARPLHDMRILIVGGGIAGLTLAALLEQRGAENVTVVEKASNYGQVGYVLGIWPLGSRILKGLNLYGKFADRGSVMSRYRVADGSGHVLHEYSLDRFADKYGPGVSLLRADIIDVLLSGLQIQPRLGVTVKELQQSDSAVNVTFTDDTSASYDLVVGADGLRSEVRKLLFGDLPLHFMGATGWAFWIDASLLPEDCVSEYWGAGQFFGLYPTPHKLCCFIAKSSAPNVPDPPAERVASIRKNFSGMGGLVPQVLAKLDENQRIFHDDFNDIRIDHWTKGRVVLIGDAAHAVVPSGGVGASLAMESAAVLADELTRTDSDYLPNALQRYVTRRRPRVDKIQQQSRQLWNMMFIQNPTLAALRDSLMRFYSEEAFLKSWESLMNEPI